MNSTSSPGAPVITTNGSACFTSRSRPSCVLSSRPAPLSLRLAMKLLVFSDAHRISSISGSGGRGPCPFGPPHVFVVDPVLDHVDGGHRADAEVLGRPGAQLGDHSVVALGLVLLHHLLHVPRERSGEDDADRRVRALLPRQQVRGEVGVSQPSHSVGASGPVSSSVSHSAARSFSSTSTALMRRSLA